MSVYFQVRIKVPKMRLL